MTKAGNFHWLPFAAAFLTPLASVGQASAAMSCLEMTGRLDRLTNARSGALSVGPAGPTFKSLYDECDSKDRFAGKALPSHRGLPLRCSTDKNRVEFVRKFANSEIVYRAKMAVDADGSPVSMGPNQSSTDQPVTWLTFDHGSERKYVNAEELSFVVVPINSPNGLSFQRASGVKKGDLAAVFAKGRCSFGVVGDAGPYFRLGEASLRTHEDLGNPQCLIPGQHPCRKLRGGGSGVGIGSGVTYILFPNTRPKPLLSQTAASVAGAAAQAAADNFLSHNSDSP